MRQAGSLPETKEARMSKRVRNRFTFSNVVAVLALFVALGGSAYAAGKFSGKQIQPKSLPGNRVKPNSLTTKQIKDATLTAGGLSNVTYVTNPVTLPGSPTATVYTATATCPAGQKVLGGGALASDTENGYINDTGPTPDHTGWTARTYNQATTFTLNVTAICTKIVP